MNSYVYTLWSLSMTSKFYFFKLKEDIMDGESSKLFVVIFNRYFSFLFLHIYLLVKTLQFYSSISQIVYMYISRSSSFIIFFFWENGEWWPFRVWEAITLTLSFFDFVTLMSCTYWLYGEFKSGWLLSSYISW